MSLTAFRIQSIDWPLQSSTDNSDGNLWRITSCSVCWYKVRLTDWFELLFLKSSVELQYPVFPQGMPDPPSKTINSFSVIIQSLIYIQTGTFEEHPKHAMCPFFCARTSPEHHKSKSFTSTAHQGSKIHLLTWFWKVEETREMGCSYTHSYTQN